MEHRRRTVPGFQLMPLPKDKTLDQSDVTFPSLTGFPNRTGRSLQELPLTIATNPVGRSS